MTEPPSEPLKLAVDDPANRAMAALVHPPEWPPLTGGEEFDLVAVGGGTAGLVAAGGAALLGANAALVERAYMGGDCLVTGCVPSKALLRAGQLAHDARQASSYGVHCPDVRVDFAQVMERLRQVRAETAKNDSASAFQERGVRVAFGNARFLGPKRLLVGDKEISFKRAVIATGARPRPPGFEGANLPGVLTSESLFDETELPARLVVVGGGPIGCEMAQALARLGSEVTLVQRAARLLPADAPEAGEILHSRFTEEGIRVLLGTEVTGITQQGKSLKVSLRGGRESPEQAPRYSECDRVLLALGRTPNIEGLGLSEAKVESSPAGVLVDARHRTSNWRNYAAGDVCSPHQFTHAAYAQAEFAIFIALFPVRMNIQKRVMPRVTYTDPEMAPVGLPYSELVRRPGAYRVWELPWKEADRAQLDGDGPGFARIYTRGGGDRVAAATFVGKHAGELLGEVALAMTAGIGLSKLGRVIQPYPTRSELVRKLADEFKFSLLRPWLLRWLGRYFRLLR